MKALQKAWKRRMFVIYPFSGVRVIDVEKETKHLLLRRRIRKKEPRSLTDPMGDMKV